MLTMTDALWVDPVNILEWLPLTREYVVRRNIKQSLLQAQFALQNPDHLPKLFSLCGKDPESISAIIGKLSDCFNLQFHLSSMSHILHGFIFKLLLSLP